MQNNISEIPIRYRYHLSLSRRRGINLSPVQYHALKTLSIIVDTKQHKQQEGKRTIIKQNTLLNKQLCNICTAIELKIDGIGTTEILIKVLDEFQTIVPWQVARDLRSRLGDMIKNRALAA